MNRNDKEKIRQNTVLLTKELTVDSVFLSYFVKNRVMTEDNIEEIGIGPTKRKKAADFLAMIIRRGPKAFGTLIEALVETHQDHLAEPLDLEEARKYIAKRDSGDHSHSVHQQEETTPPAGATGPFPTPGQQTAPCKKTKPSVNNEGSAFMKVNVVQSALMDQRIQELLHDQENTYRILPRKRGRAIIINNETFMTPKEGPKLSEREGTAYDLINLDELLQKLHFETKVYTNCTKQHILSILESESKNPAHAEASAFILCILSHGAQGYAYGVDGNKVSIEDELCAAFDGTHCPALHGKPKIFIIQACQGKASTVGVPVADSPEVNEITENLKALEMGDQKDAAPQFLKEKTRHEKADMLIAYSTVGGYKSWRRPDLGSWFVRAIVDTFAERAHNEHIVDMLTKVRRKVLEMETSHGAGDLYVQVTKTDSTLSRDFYFFPGFIETTD